jgi:hypothetical protein
MTTSVSANGISMPEMVSIKATEISAPPAWALMERNLINLMEEAAPMVVKKYTEPGGALYFAEDFDDLYEQFYNWCLFYSIGADESTLNFALQEWNATTRISDDSFNHRLRHNDFTKVFRPSMHNEFWNLAQAMEWHHLGEGNMAFYDFGVACPTVSENVRRARRFAAMFIGEDPEAPNYDPEHKILRSPFHSSQGPRLHGDADFANTMLLAGRFLGGEVNYYGVRASLYPIVEDLELNWYEDPKRRAEIVELFEKMVLQSDTPNSLGATALVTNAYLYTGDEKYKRWVLEYTEAWLDRMRRNNGIMPDNVGPTGKIGEHRNGVWWGGQYGWNHYQGYNIMFHSLTIAAECALLLTGDFGYLELLRSQIQLMLENSITREDGQLIMPTRYGPDGWCYDPPVGPSNDDILPKRGVYTGPIPWRMQELAHLYHASMSTEDYELITRIRDGEVERDWNEIGDRGGEKNGGETEFARFQYYDGLNPDWPEKILSAEYRWAVEAFDKIRLDDRTVEEIITTNYFPPNPVFTKGLTQVTMGAPQSVYNGGLLRATVRYFDRDNARPGLPRDVAALVDKLGADAVGIQLVNLSNTETRNAIVQAGAFGEHQFTGLKYRSMNQEELRQNPYLWLRSEREYAEKETSVNGKYFAVELPPSTSVRLEVGMRRFVNNPSYAFPWHGETIPVPFQ